MDLLKYFNDKGIDVSEAGAKNVSKGWVGIKCPLPSCSDHSNHCGINKKTHFFKCHKCGEKGHVEKLISIIEGCDYKEAKKIYKKYGGNKSSFDDLIYDNSKKEFAKNVVLPNCERSFPEIHLKYLIDRGFDPYFLIEKYKLKSCYMSDEKYNYRIIIPFFLNNRFITFTSRAVVEDVGIKYLHCPVKRSILDPKSTLYNIDSLHYGSNVALLEGVTDVWRIGDFSVAMMGKSMIIPQVSLLLLKNPSKIYIILDADASDDSEKLSFYLSQFFTRNRIEVIHISNGDPCELPPTDVRTIKRLLLKK